MSFILNRMSEMSIVPPNVLQARRSNISLNLQGFGQKQELFNIKSVPIRNAKKESYHQKKILLLETFITFINVLIIIITIFKNFRPQYFHQDSTIITDDELIEYRLLFIFCICAVVLNLAKNVSKIHLEQQNEQENQVKFFKLWIKLTIESLFYIAHPSYFTKDYFLSQISPDLKINRILSCFVYIRVIEILGFLFKISRFHGLRVNRILALYIGDKNHFEILYTIKCYLKQNGLKSPFIIYFTIILTFPFFLMALQIKYFAENNQLLNYNGFLEAIYDTVITMTTVGYGDMNHCQSFQRALFAIIIVIGSLSSSFFTLTFLNWVQFSIQQQKAFRCNFLFISAIKRLSIKQKINQINNQKVKKFVRTLIEIQKSKKRSNLKNGKVKSHILQVNSHEIEHNQIQQKKSNQFSQTLLPKIINPQSKLLNQSLCENQDTFRDFYERSQIELNHSIKLLIERILLTGNLMEFYLMRQRNSKKKNEGPSSSQSIKSRRRVDDNIKMYDLRMKIIEATYSKQNQNEKKSVSINQNIQNQNDLR